MKSKEISEGIVLDYDPEGRIVGIDIDNASNKDSQAAVTGSGSIKNMKCVLTRSA